MTPKALLDLLIFATNAKTDEEIARVAWRASDFMWLMVPAYDIRLCRMFNNLCDDKNKEGWPQIKNLIPKEELFQLLEKEYPGWKRPTSTSEKP